MKDERLKDSMLITYFVKKIEDSIENKQIGKTVIQKMMYLLENECDLDFDYSMYHYGPFSKEVATNLEKAEKKDLVEMRWDKNKGYYINTSKSDIDFNEYISESEQKTIDKLVEKYGEYNAQELSIIATGLYVKNDHDDISDDKLVELVHELKPKHSKDRIEFLVKATELT